MGTAWQLLSDELNKCGDSGQAIEFWWRDDDAVEDSPALQRLLDSTDRREIPLLLAVIPDLARPELADTIARTSYVDLAQHGCTHKNNAGLNEKKIELGGVLNDETVLRALANSRSMFETMFSGRVVDILVPPWNRIRPSLIPQLPTLGLLRLSRYRTLSRSDTLGVREIDTEIDIVDWRGTRGFIGEREVIEQLTDRLAQRRQGMLTGPLGVLTHHLVHDAGCWQFMERLGTFVSDHPAAKWLRIAEL